MHEVIGRAGSAAAATYEFYLRLITASERPPSFVLLDVGPAEGAPAPCCLYIMKVAPAIDAARGAVDASIRACAGAWSLLLHGVHASSPRVDHMQYEARRGDGRGLAVRQRTRSAAAASAVGCGRLQGRRRRGSGRVASQGAATRRSGSRRRGRRGGRWHGRPRRSARRGQC